jgi:hypothetical protein
VKQVSERSFEGAVGEVATLRVSCTGTGAVRMWLDGHVVAAEVRFPLEALRRVAVLLAGDPEETATVEIAEVDGASYHDVILVTVHDPMPMHHYGFRAV